MSKTIGALWKPKSKSENSPKLLGQIEIIAGIPQQIAIFENKKKTKDNQPDFNIVLNELQKEEKKEQKPSSYGKEKEEYL